MWKGTEKYPGIHPPLRQSIPLPLPPKTSTLFLSMAILTRADIVSALQQKSIIFSPSLDAFQLQPHAVDLRLGYRFLIPRNWMVDQKGRCAIKISIDDTVAHREQFDEVILTPGQYFDLLPNEFVIATSLEHIEMNDPHLMAILFPRTSTNRRGINLSLSGIIDTGYKGHLIFPMKNEAGNQVLRIYPGERVCQIIFEELTHALTDKEANQHGLEAAKYSSQNSPHYQLDKEEERQFLAQGKLDELKQQYPLS